MQIVPVLDLMHGQVVRGVAGRREEYRPIVSRITSSTDPLGVARAMRDRFGFTELYLADLDAIAGGDPSLAHFADLQKVGFQLWVDAGVGPAGKTLDALAAVGVQSLVAGLESLRGPDELNELVRRFGPTRLVFSLDLRDGKPLGQTGGWERGDGWTIGRQALGLGVERILVLDLAGVGMSQGSKTAELCGRLRLHPDEPAGLSRRDKTGGALEISTGGGVRGVDDLRHMRLIGVDKVLMASALHDGRLSAEEIEEYR